MAADGVNSLNLVVVHGHKRVPLTLSLPADEPGEKLSVHHLKDLIQERLGIVPGGQKLIFKGKILPDSQKLEALGIKDGSNVMLLSNGATGGGVYTKETENKLQMEKISEEIEKGNKTLSDIIYEVDGIHRGLVTLRGRTVLLPKLQNRLGHCIEGFTRLLENLDGIDCGHSEPNRAFRKELVNKIQKLLDQADRSQTELLYHGKSETDLS